VEEWMLLPVVLLQQQLSLSVVSQCFLVVVVVGIISVVSVAQMWSCGAVCLLKL